MDNQSKRGVTRRKEGSVLGKRRSERRGGNDPNTKLPRREREADKKWTAGIIERLRTFHDICVMNNKSKRGLTKRTKGSVCCNGKVNGNPDGYVRRNEDGEGGEEEKNEEDGNDDVNEEEGNDGDDDDSEGDNGGALESLSLDDFVRIMGDAVANGEAIPQEHNRTRRERKQYLGGLINADPATTSELRHELGSAFLHRFGQPTFSAEQAAFVFRRIRDLNGDANNISSLLRQLHQTTQPFRLRLLTVIYNHPDPARQFEVRATVGDERLTMNSTVEDLLEMMRIDYTNLNIPPLLELHENVTQFSIELQGQRVVVVNRLKDVRLYELIRDIARIRPGRFSLSILPRGPMIGRSPLAVIPM